MEQFKVGEVAERANVTVRTLHHYEAIGLLRPTHSVGSGHRLYSVADLQRLQQILSLRQLGLTLKEIGQCLDDSDFDPSHWLERHLVRTRQLMQAQERLCQRLEHLQTILYRAETVSATLLFDTMEAITMAENQFNLPPQEAEALQGHWAQFSQDQIEAVQNEWPGLIAQMKEAQSNGVDPADPAVQTLAKRWAELVAMFTGGNVDVQSQLKDRYETDSAMQQKSGIDPELMQYVQQAHEHQQS